MSRVPACAVALALGIAAAPALAQQGARPPGRPTAERAPLERTAPERAGAGPVIACPSLANYRQLLRAGTTAAAAVLADPRADHLGCTLLARGRITGVTDRVALAGRNYDCLGVQGTTACHWAEPSGAPAQQAR